MTTISHRGPIKDQNPIKATLIFSLLQLNCGNYQSLSMVDGATFLRFHFGLNVAFKHHIATVPACSSGILNNVLPHRNVRLQTQDMTPHPVTAYRHRADLLYYSLMWNVTLEYTATHFNVYTTGKSFPDLPHTPTNAQLYDTDMMIVSRKLGRKYIYCTNQVLNPGPVVRETNYTICSPCTAASPHF